MFPRSDFGRLPKRRTSVRHLHRGLLLDSRGAPLAPFSLKISFLPLQLGDVPSPRSFFGNTLFPIRVGKYNGFW